MYLVKISPEKTETIKFRRNLKYFQEQVGGLIEIVRLEYSDNLILICDEEGRLKRNQFLNIAASRLYGEKIFGTVLLARTAYMPDGTNICGLELNEANAYENMIKQIIRRR